MSTHTHPNDPENVWPDDGSEDRAIEAAQDELRPHAYLLAKLRMVMPLFEEARDALCAIREDQRIRHGIRKDLADRMDRAGTYSVDDWKADRCA